MFRRPVFACLERAPSDLDLPLDERVGNLSIASVSCDPMISRKHVAYVVDIRVGLGSSSGG